MERIKPGNQRTEELNSRINQRNIPTHQLQSTFDIRPVSTKYASMPLIDRREIPTVPIVKRPSYNMEQTFNPGNAQGPWSGFANNVNKESQLRNQFFALQRGAGQGVYIPSKDSDMYETKIKPTNDVSIQQQFPYLFEKPSFEPFHPCPENMGINMFDNCTRQQVKEL
jgi:hypothetical protein